MMIKSEYALVTILAVHRLVMPIVERNYESYHNEHSHELTHYSCISHNTFSIGLVHIPSGILWDHLDP